MENFEKTEIKINLSPTFWDKAPQAKVFVNEQCFYDSEIKESTDIDISVNLPEGQHRLIIELHNKNKYQTVLENDKIIKDQLLNINNISFDEIDIGYLSHRLSKYYPDQNVYNQAVPLLVNNCVNLGYNGRWELEFTTPIYIWLLENI